MLPAGLVATAMQLCAAGLSGASGASPRFTIAVDRGATLSRKPENGADAEATVPDLIAAGAVFEPGPLSMGGRVFATYDTTAAAVLDPCALAHVPDARAARPTVDDVATVTSVSALLRRAFAARITDTLRPMNASYGARYSWHKAGQAIDFVPAAGVGSITRGQVRALMAARGIRLLELLGPGDPGHSTHWHLAFARPGQLLDHSGQVEEDEAWLVDVASAKLPRLPAAASDAPASPSRPVTPAPPSWDVFAAAEWRTAHGDRS